MIISSIIDAEKYKLFTYNQAPTSDNITMDIIFSMNIYFELSFIFYDNESDINCDANIVKMGDIITIIVPCRGAPLCAPSHPLVS